MRVYQFRHQGILIFKLVRLPRTNEQSEFGAGVYPPAIAGMSLLRQAGGPACHIGILKLVIKRQHLRKII
jgi:hypothetical protein